jgi:putative SOS response-associated peptidase YedK
MCGRFTLRTPTGVLAEEFSLLDVPECEPRYNIAPTQPAAVVRATAPGPDAPRRCDMLRWGLIPSWAADPSIGARLINARSETASVKPAFRAALRRRRCLIAADGFYEWQRTGRTKQPFLFRMRRQSPFGFAGLWETWEGPDHAALTTCTILTTEASDPVRPIHDRMPIIVRPEDYATWLDPAIQPADAIAELLRPWAGDALLAQRVGMWVNSPSHEDRRCIEPA